MLLAERQSALMSKITNDGDSGRQRVKAGFGLREIGTTCSYCWMPFLTKMNSQLTRYRWFQILNKILGWLRVRLGFPYCWNISCQVSLQAGCPTSRARALKGQNHSLGEGAQLSSVFLPWHRQRDIFPSFCETPGTALQRAEVKNGNHLVKIRVRKMLCKIPRSVKSVFSVLVLLGNPLWKGDDHSDEYFSIIWMEYIILILRLCLMWRLCMDGLYWYGSCIAWNVRFVRQSVRYSDVLVSDSNTVTVLISVNGFFVC